METKNIYIIAASIVIAGLIVAGSLSLSKNSSAEEQEVNQSSGQSSPQIPSSGPGCGV